MRFFVMLLKNFNFIITTNAIRYFKKLVKNRDIKNKTNIKAFVNNKNTINVNIDLMFCYKKEEEKTDKLLKFNFFNLYFSKVCSFYLQDSLIDFKKKLTIKAPFLKKKIFCNNKDLYKLRLSLEFFVTNKINKILEKHGGSIRIIKLTSHGILFVCFSGNCSSCYSLHNTFQNIVKKEILKNYKQITDVIVS